MRSHRQPTESVVRRPRGLMLAAAVATALLLSGCGEGGLPGGLRRAGIGGTPDEFMVLPTRPLEMPEDLKALPPPTPGAVNRVAYRPRTDAITGLTGRPAVAAGGGALVARAGPSSPAIRQQLAVEDAEWRRTHHGKLLERWFSKDRNALVYDEMLLDAPYEYQRLRAAGLRVPAAPPEALEE